MKVRCWFASTTFSVLTTSIALGAPPTSSEQARARRVVVAGPEDDLIAARVEKELTALGFEPVRVGALEGCARSAVIVAALDSNAIAATCSDGDQVGVWIADGASLRLRDVVVARADGTNDNESDRGRETTAVRAAEVTRATIALREAEEDPARTAPPPPPPVTTTSTTPGGWEKFDTSEPKPAPPPPTPRHAPRFYASAGASALMGVDASVGALSGQVGVGIHKRLSLAARIEYPFEAQRLVSSAGIVRVAPAFAGAGLELPLFTTSSFVIPRFGAGIGAAWMRVSKLPQDSFDFGNLGAPVVESSDVVASPAGYLSAGVSMRVYGPMRLMVDGIFGTTLGRFVARDQGEEVAYWGQPLASLAARVEVMLR